MGISPFTSLSVADTISTCSLPLLLWWFEKGRSWMLKAHWLWNKVSYALRFFIKSLQRVHTTPNYVTTYDETDSISNLLICLGWQIVDMQRTNNWVLGHCSNKTVALFTPQGNARGLDMSFAPSYTLVYTHGFKKVFLVYVSPLNPFQPWPQMASSLGTISP